MMHRKLFALAAAAVFAASGAQAAPTASEASAVLSVVPIAVSVVAPVALLSGGAMLTVAAVESTATGTVWVLQRASDGAKVSVEFSGAVLVGGALAVGSVVSVSVIATGTVLSAAGAAIAFIPNAIGASLLYNEQLTPERKDGKSVR